MKTQRIDLPVEGFAILIKAAATAIINHLEQPSNKVDAKFLHQQVGILDELVSKFELLHVEDGVEP